MTQPDAHLAKVSMTYQVTHRTEYLYESEVSASYGQVILLPRELAGQRCRSSQVEFDPGVADYRERVDFFGNRAAYFAILEPHTRLVVTARSLVDVDDRAEPELGGSPSWEVVRDQVAVASDDDALEARQFLLQTPLTEASDGVVSFAAPSFPPGRPVLEAVADLSSRIHDSFEFSPGSTTVTTTPDELLANGSGVCQDFAHLAIASLRSLGLPARYVSGYLETLPPPGQPKLRGADVSHAWVSVWVPGDGWTDIDPTNDQLVNQRYVTLGWGRDYADVPPLKGVIYTQGTRNDLTVEVDVVEV